MSRPIYCRRGDVQVAPDRPAVLFGRWRQDPPCRGPQPTTGGAPVPEPRVYAPLPGPGS